MFVRVYTCYSAKRVQFSFLFVICLGFTYLQYLLRNEVVQKTQRAVLLRENLPARAVDSGETRYPVRGLQHNFYNSSNHSIKGRFHLELRLLIIVILISGLASRLRLSCESQYNSSSE